MKNTVNEKELHILLSACNAFPVCEVPTNYSDAIETWTTNYIRKTAIGSETVNKDFLMARINNIVHSCLENGEDVPATTSGIDEAVTKKVSLNFDGVKYTVGRIMLSRTEERAVIEAYQNADREQKKCVLDVAFTFLTPLFKPHYDRFVKHYMSFGIDRDEIAQELVIGVIGIFDKFDLSMNIGLTENFIYTNLYSHFRSVFKSECDYQNHKDELIGIVSDDDTDENVIDRMADTKNIIEDIQLNETVRNVLTEKQLKVITLSNLGYSNVEIARKVQMSGEKAVRDIKTSAGKKLCEVLGYDYEYLKSAKRRANK